MKLLFFFLNYIYIYIHTHTVFIVIIGFKQLYLTLHSCFNCKPLKPKSLSLLIKIPIDMSKCYIV